MKKRFISLGWPKRLTQISLASSLLVLNTTGLFTQQAIDGVARATVHKPSTSLKLTASPKRNNSGVIKITEGQALTLHLKATSSTDQNRNDLTQLHALPVELTGDLPEGASYVNTCTDDATKTCGEGDLTWIPKLGDAARYTAILLTFNVHNHLNGSTAKKWVLLDVKDNSAPRFSEELPATLTAVVGQRQQLELIAIPAIDENNVPHRLKIELDPETPLPKGAKLGKIHRGPDGNWHRTLSWKPALTQLELAGSLNFLVDNADVYGPAADLTQDEYVLNYSVVGSPTPP